MVNRGVMEGGKVVVDVKDGEFTFDVRKGPEKKVHGVRARAAARV